MKNNPKVSDAHVYFPAALYVKLRKVAKRKRRSISAEIVIAVENHLEADSKWVRDPRVPRGQGFME